MMTLGIGLLALFVLVAAVHLLLCFRENDHGYALTKPFLMPLLAGSAGVLLVPFLPDTRMFLLCTTAALAFGTVGDIALIKTTRPRFVTGSVLFLVGHFFWIFQHAATYTIIRRSTIAVFVAGYAIGLVLIWFFLGKPRGVYAFVIVLYGIAISVLNFTGITLVIASGHYAGWLFLAGSMLFIISDTMLCYSIIQREFPHARFFIMLTYITAQASLTAASLLPFYRP